jgi:urease accessory protein
MSGAATSMERGRSVLASVAGGIAAGTVAVVVVSTPAGAHVGGPVHGLADGVLHPLTGIDHLLAMVAVGVVAALGSTRRWWMVPAAFLAGMITGGAFGMLGAALPAVELAIAASVVGLGLAIVLAPRVDAGWLLALLAVAGVAHGSAHGAEAPSAVHPVLYVVGFVALTAALHAAGVFGGLMVRRVPSARVLAGAGVAAAGVLLLG